MEAVSPSCNDKRLRNENQDKIENQDRINFCWYILLLMSKIKSVFLSIRLLDGFEKDPLSE